jgi:hypothetical protein
VTAAQFASFLVGVGTRVLGVVQAPSEAFYTQLARLLNRLRPTFGDCVARFVELSKACIPPPALGATSAVATPTVDADVDGDHVDDTATSKTDSTTSVGNLSSREGSELTSSVDSDEESSSSSSSTSSSCGGSDSEEGDVSASASDGAVVSPEIVPGLAPSSPGYPAPPAVPSQAAPPTRLVLAPVSGESPMPPSSSPPPLTQRPWKRDDVLHCASDAVLLEDFELAGFEPYAIVASSRHDDVTAFRTRFGLESGCTLERHVERCRSSFEASGTFVPDVIACVFVSFPSRSL